MLAKGDVAPDFDLPDCVGQPVNLRKFRGKKVVLFFFPKAFTSGCTAEVRAFRDNQALIEHHNAVLIGVSVDNAQRQCAFAAAERIDFALVGDDTRQLSEAYGVLWPWKRDRRVTFIIDEQGVIENVIHHEVRVHLHLEDVLQALQRQSAA